MIPFTLRLHLSIICRLSWTAGGLRTKTRADFTHMADGSSNKDETSFLRAIFDLGQSWVGSYQ